MDTNDDGEQRPEMHRAAWVLVGLLIVMFSGQIIVRAQPAPLVATPIAVQPAGMPNPPSAPVRRENAHAGNLDRSSLDAGVGNLAYPDLNRGFACTDSLGQFLDNVRSCAYWLGWGNKSEVRYHDSIIWSANHNDIPALILAASVIHQSDPVWPDRLIGDEPERFLWRFRPEMSVGLGQIRAQEAQRFGGPGKEQDLFNPISSIEYLARKIADADGYIQGQQGWSATDRFMLLSIAQNDGTEPVQEFFETYHGDWQAFLFDTRGGQRHPEELRWQLWSILQKTGWLLYEKQGWELPPGVDLDEYRERLYPHHI